MDGHVYNQKMYIIPLGNLKFLEICCKRSGVSFIVSLCNMFGFSFWLFVDFVLNRLNERWLVPHGSVGGVA